MASHKQPSILATSQRLKLRPLNDSAQDANALFRYRNQAEVALFQGWTPKSPQEVTDYAKAMAQRQPAQAGHWYQVILETLESRQIIGDVAFCIDTDTGRQAELGIALDPDSQGQGFATEAITALCDYLFQQQRLHRIHVVIDPRNQASIKLCQRIGFRQEGLLKQASYFKGEWVDDLVMALLASEWPAA